MSSVQFTFAREGKKTEPERLKLRISTVRSRCQEMAGEDNSRMEKA
jgi:hypothetical protein